MTTVMRDESRLCPVVDAHHHLWDLSMRRHPWLTTDANLPGLGDLSYLRDDYGVDDFLADSAGCGVAATVHVEALWDPARDPAEETAWLDGLPLRDGVAIRCVAAAPLRAPDVERVLEGHLRHPRVTGIRQTLRWHPEPALRWSDEKLIDDADWRRGVGLVARHGLLLELLMNPWQAHSVADLAAEFPSLTIVVDHCSSPTDRDEAGIRRWRDGLDVMGRKRNIHMKLSNYARYAAAHTTDAAREVLMPCIDAFGADRCLWGSDYPVARSGITYAGSLDLFRRALAPLPARARCAILHDNAVRLYGIPRALATAGLDDGDRPSDLIPKGSVQ